MKPQAAAALDVARLRREFPILSRSARGKPLVYLDNANSTQKPESVIEAESRFYRERYANIHRGVYELSQEATAAYDAVREKVRRFIHAGDSREIVFVRGTTEAINLVARSFGRPRLAPGDEVLITTLEHHSGIVPWQMACEEAGAALRVIPIGDDGELRLEEAERMMGPRTKILSAIHVSNALGTVSPVKELVAMARARGIPVLLDGAQAVCHRRIDVQDLDCDFYAFSGHKLYGPTGIGVLYGKAEHLEAMPPYQGGGDMILSVTFEKTLYNEIPYKFEAGTPNLAGTVALGAAIDWVERVGIEAIAAHEALLLRRTEAMLSEIPGVTIVGHPKERAGVVSFTMKDTHPHDIGTVLDLEGIAVRAGHHCAQPLLERLGVRTTVRASFAVYNTEDEVAALGRGLRKVQEVFR